MWESLNCWRHKTALEFDARLVTVVKLVKYHKMRKEKLCKFMQTVQKHKKYPQYNANLNSSRKKIVIYSLGNRRQIKLSSMPKLNCGNVATKHFN